MVDFALAVSLSSASDSIYTLLHGLTYSRHSVDTSEYRCFSRHTVELKLFLCLIKGHAMRTPGSGRRAPWIRSLGIRWMWVVNFTPTPLHPQGKDPLGAHCIGVPYWARDLYFCAQSIMYRISLISCDLVPVLITVNTMLIALKMRLP